MLIPSAMTRPRSNKLSCHADQCWKDLKCPCTTASNRKRNKNGKIAIPKHVVAYPPAMHPHRLSLILSPILAQFHPHATSLPTTVKPSYVIGLNVSTEQPSCSTRHHPTCFPQMFRPHVMKKLERNWKETGDHPRNGSPQ